MNNSPTLSDVEVNDQNSFINRLFGDAQGAFNIFAIHIGDRLGFYRELSKGQSLDLN